MDRREAIKKLAAGGAIAAGGSMILSSNNVAFASSHCEFVNVPLNGDNLPLVATDAGTGILDIAVSPLPGCTCGMSPTYQWVLVSGSVTPWHNSLSATQVTSSTVRLHKTDRRGRPKGFHSNDSFVLTLATSWRCDTQCIAASYEVSGVYGSPPPIAVQNSYAAC
jgi:hypothetical protein